MESDWKSRFINTPTEASRSGFQAIKKFRGKLMKPELVAGRKWATDDPGKAVKETLILTWTEVQIIEMDKGKPQPDLENDTFKIYIPYAVKDADPDKGTKVVGTIIKSAADLWIKRGQKGKGWTDLVDTVTMVERRPWKYTISQKPTEEGGKRTTQSGEADGYFFVEDEVTSPVDVADDIKTRLVLGQKRGTVLRNLNMDDVAKRHPEYKIAFNSGTFDDMLNVVLNEDEVYVEKTKNP